jgi:multicomponent Na+:H+ antiporter subunit C
VIWTIAIVAGIAGAAGLYLALSRDVLRCVLGLSIVGAAVNLVVFAMARVQGPAPPIVPAGAAALDGGINPLPQALVLTAIVIGFALTCFSLVLAVRLMEQTGADDSEALRFAEPPPVDPKLPPVDDDPAAGSGH